MILTNVSKCALKIGVAACCHNRNDLSSDLELPCLGVQRWLMCQSCSSLSPSSVWGVNPCPSLLEIKCSVLQKPSNNAWLTATVIHHQDELDLRCLLLVNAHLKHLVCVLKLSFQGKCLWRSDTEEREKLDWIYLFMYHTAIPSDLVWDCDETWRAEYWKCCLQEPVCQNNMG